MTPIMTPSLGGFFTPIIPTLSAQDGLKEVSASFVSTKKFELLNKVSGRGLKMEYRFSRSQHLMSSAMINIEITFSNESNDTIENIRVGNKVCC